LPKLWSDPEVEPKVELDEGLLADELDELEDEALELAPGVVDEVVLRLPPTRDVADRNAAEPPPVCRPLVDVTDGVEAAELDPVVLEEELPLLLDDDNPPPPPRELDWSTEEPPPPLPPPELRKLPPRPLPLRFPRSCGLIKEENLSAPVVPVRRMVRCKTPWVTVPVRIAAAAASGAGRRLA
jgi:hypothetical protein